MLLIPTWDCVFNGRLSLRNTVQYTKYPCSLISNMTWYVIHMHSRPTGATTRSTKAYYCNKVGTMYNAAEFEDLIWYIM